MYFLILIIVLIYIKVITHYYGVVIIGVVCKSNYITLKTNAYNKDLLRSIV